MKNTIKQSERLEFNIGRSFSDAMAVLLVLGFSMTKEGTLNLITTKSSSEFSLCWRSTINPLKTNYFS